MFDNHDIINRYSSVKSRSKINELINTNLEKIIESCQPTNKNIQQEVKESNEKCIVPEILDDDVTKLNIDDIKLSDDSLENKIEDLLLVDDLNLDLEASDDMFAEVLNINTDEQNSISDNKVNINDNNNYDSLVDDLSSNDSNLIENKLSELDVLISNTINAPMNNKPNTNNLHSLIDEIIGNEPKATSNFCEETFHNNIKELFEDERNERTAINQPMVIQKERKGFKRLILISSALVIGGGISYLLYGNEINNFVIEIYNQIINWRK